MYAEDRGLERNLAEGLDLEHVWRFSWQPDRQHPAER